MPALKPENITEFRKSRWPEAVFNVINALIAEDWNGKRAKFKLKTLKTRLEEAGYNDKQFWDFEDIYRANGWKVEFCSPDYTESWDSYFILETG